MLRRCFAALRMRLGYGEAAFEQVAVFVFGCGVRLGLVLLPKPQLGDGAAQAGIVAEDTRDGVG